MKEADVRVGQRVRWRSPDKSLDQRRWKYGVVSSEEVMGQRGPLIHTGTVGRKVLVDTGTKHPSGATRHSFILPRDLQLVRT